MRHDKKNWIKWLMYQIFHIFYMVNSYKRKYTFDLLLTGKIFHTQKILQLLTMLRMSVVRVEYQLVDQWLSAIVRPKTLSSIATNMQFVNNAKELVQNLFIWKTNKKLFVSLSYKSTDIIIIILLCGMCVSNGPSQELTWR